MHISAIPRCGMCTELSTSSSFHHKYPVGLVFRYFLKTLTHTHGALITRGWAPFSLQKGVMFFLTLFLLLLGREAYSDTSCFPNSALAWVPYSHRHALSNSLCSLNPFQIHFIQSFFLYKVYKVVSGSVKYRRCGSMWAECIRRGYFVNKDM